MVEAGGAAAVGSVAAAVGVVAGDGAGIEACVQGLDLASEICRVQGGAGGPASTIHLLFCTAHSGLHMHLAGRRTGICEVLAGAWYKMCGNIAIICDFKSDLNALELTKHWWNQLLWALCTVQNQYDT